MRKIVIWLMLVLTIMLCLPTEVDARGARFRAGFRRGARFANRVAFNRFGFRGGYAAAIFADRAAFVNSSFVANDVSYGYVAPAASFTRVIQQEEVQTTQVQEVVPAAVEVREVRTVAAPQLVTHTIVTRARTCH